MRLVGGGTILKRTGHKKTDEERTCANAGNLQKPITALLRNVVPHVYKGASGSKDCFVNASEGAFRDGTEVLGKNSRCPGQYKQ